MATAIANILYEKLKNIQTDNPLCAFTKEKCQRIAPVISRIRELKKEKNALILAHSYVHPDIVYGVADYVGDSYELSKKAKQAEETTIVFAAVRFMVETAKILSPHKFVLDPNPYGGCSLAESITQEEVHALRRKYPDHTFICYINTTADVKAACDVCVTSSNVYRIIERIPTNKIFFLPDRLMAQNIQRYMKEKKIAKELLYSDGTCYVHENFTGSDIDSTKVLHPDVIVLAHPECKPEVASKADYVGSTSQMFQYVEKYPDKKAKFLLLTECGIASRLQAEQPERRLIGTCHMCKYMRSNSLEQVLKTLENPTPSQIVSIPDEVQAKAMECIEKMFYYAEL